MISRLAVLLVCMATAGLAFSFFNVVLDEWELFKIVHKKSYRSDVEESFRMKIFIENKRKVANHNMRYTEGKETYTMEMNKFGDMLPNEMSIMHGYKPSEKPSDEPATFIGPDDDIVLPDTVDWRNKGAVTHVKDQGQCGSCWAFSATGSLEGQHFRKDGVLANLSEQNLIDCSLSYGNDGCDGGLMDYAYLYIKDHGIDTEKSYPYHATDEGFCSFNNKTIGAWDKGYVDIKSGDELALKKAVATIGPISVAIFADGDFTNYKNGVFYARTCKFGRVNHGVLVVGYGTESGQDYWLVKNSWGPSWGLDGYLMMSRNRDNNCYIASSASYPLV